MATTGTRKLSIVYGKTSTYVSVSNLDRDSSLLGYNMPLRLWLNKSGTATLTDAAKEILFPNAKAHMTQLDVITNLGALGSPLANVYFKADGVTYLASEKLKGSESSNNITYRNIIETLTNNTVTSMTRNSNIEFQLTQASTGLLVAATLGADADALSGYKAGITLIGTFKKWDVQAKVGTQNVNDVEQATLYNSISVSNATPWDYDEVTFSVDLKPEGTFKGWYSDEACTQLVSKDVNYTTEITSDLTLYAVVSASKFITKIIEDKNVLKSSATAQGDTATYTFSVEYPKNVEFFGWYSDAEKTQLVSKEKTFEKELTEDITLYTDSVALEYEVYQGDKRIKENYIGDYKFS